MKVLLNYFVDLCLLRSAPQDLPGSAFLLRLSLVLYVMVGVVMIVNADMGVATAFMESVFEVSLMLASLYFGLKLFGKPMRFQQTATALLGSGILLGLLTLPLVTWSQQGESSEAGLLLLALLIWNMVVMGHILRHSFETRFGQGLGIAVLYSVMSWILIINLFPGTV